MNPYLPSDIYISTMPLSGTYTGNHILYNGMEEHDDGTITITKELIIPFQRNRFCNPLGRILGPKGQTIRWLRRKTTCDLVVHTNDTRFLKVDSKITIKKRSTPAIAIKVMKEVIPLISSIINPNDVHNTYMSDYQLFHPEDPENATLEWLPSNFNSENSGPKPSSIQNLLTINIDDFKVIQPHPYAPVNLETAPMNTQTFQRLPTQYFRQYAYPTAAVFTGFPYGFATLNGNFLGAPNRRF